MKNSKEILKQWNEMLDSGRLPIFEIELKGEEYSIIDINYYVGKNNRGYFRISSAEFNSDKSKYIKYIYLPVDKYNNKLDSYLEELLEISNDILSRKNLLL